jgi:uncharacterized peroxidase-related enzyme
MSRIAPLDLADARGPVRDLLTGVEKMLGAVPNMFRVAARAPAALEALVGLFAASSHGTLSASDREVIAVAVAEANGCDYCLSAHTALGQRARLSNQQLEAARRGISADGRVGAMLSLAGRIVANRGRLDESDLVAARGVGLTDPEILEVVTNVALNLFTNYLNLVADTEIDFPVVRAGVRS